MKQLTGRASSMPVGLAIGSGSALGITLLGSALLAKLIEKEVLAEDKMGYGVMVILILSAFLGAMIAAGKIKHRKAVVCIGAGGIYFMLLLSITALFFGGIYDGMGVTMLLVLCGSGLAILTCLKENRGGKRTKVKIPNR